MTLIVNLSTTHDYSIDEIVTAFVNICDKYSVGKFQEYLGFFQNKINYAWVYAKYLANQSTLIEPYKLGNISSSEFLDNLTEIFEFLKGMDKDQRDEILIQAWNASIKLSEKTKERFSILVEESKKQPVYLISNTNELDAKAILELFKQNNPDIVFNQNIDTSIQESQEPIELLPNVYLCLSYRYKAFKEESVSTSSMIETMSKTVEHPITLISQYPGDIKKAEQLGFATINADEFYDSKKENLPSLNNTNSSAM